MIHSISRILAVFCSITFLFVFAGFYAKHFWPLELITPFYPHYGVFLLLAFLFFTYNRLWKWAAKTGIGIIVVGIMVLPLYVGSTGAQEPDLRVMTMNVLYINENVGLIATEILNEDPDIIGFVEMDNLVFNALADSLNDSYPYAHFQDDEGPFSVGVISKTPVYNEQSFFFTTRNMPLLRVTTDIKETPVTFFVAHPTWPMGKTATSLRNEYYAEMNKQVVAVDTPVVLMGDFNMTPWSPHFRTLLKETGLKNTLKGFGIQNTWATHLPWFIRIPLDHVFVSQSINVVGRHLGNDIESDHLPVVVDLVIH